MDIMFVHNINIIMSALLTDGVCFRKSKFQPAIFQERYQFLHRSINGKNLKCFNGKCPLSSHTRSPRFFYSSILRILDFAFCIFHFSHFDHDVDVSVECNDDNSIPFAASYTITLCYNNMPHQHPQGNVLQSPEILAHQSALAKQSLQQFAHITSSFYIICGLPLYHYSYYIIVIVIARFVS